jgi:tRNA-specific 2-thiouridylase
MKIAIGLSGGVDSTIAAYLLKEEGHDLIGLTMKIWDDSFVSSNTKSACFGPDEIEDIEDAQKVCDFLNIPLHVIDLSKEYSSNILKYFKDEYTSGRTPNPCIKCNQMMKFNLLLAKAKEDGVKFDRFATGHYARVIFDESKKKYLLKKGLDPKKDQSYFLGLLKQEQLSQVIFPLGEYKKEDVKKIAQKLNLFVHEKKESQDFYSGDYSELLDELPEIGDIIDKNGKVLGRHKGICNYTIGQRKGLGISYKEPLYVIEIRKFDNSVVVGTEKDLYKSEFTVMNPNWIAIEKPKDSIRTKARIRYLHKEADAVIKYINENTIKITFDEPQRAIAPGQFSVFYDEDTVVGAGIIEETY